MTLMNGFSAIQWVSSGLSLVAFIVAAALLAYRSRLKHRAEIISSARAEDRIEAISATAEIFRVDISGLHPAQQENIVMAQLKIRARRELMIAVFGLIIAIFFFSVVVITIILTNMPINALDHQKPTKTLQAGPVMLQPGETRGFSIDLSSRGNVDIIVNSISPDWTGRATQKAAWMKAGKGNTPELWLNVCSAVEEQNCASGSQKGINGSLRRELPPGPATVIFFNFRDSPPVTFSTTINYPD